MGKKDDDLARDLARAEELIKKFEEDIALAIETKKTIKEILKSGWEDGLPILQERKKELERRLEVLDIFLEDDDFPHENDQIH